MSALAVAAFIIGGFALGHDRRDPRVDLAGGWTMSGLCNWCDRGLPLLPKGSMFHSTPQKIPEHFNGSFQALCYATVLMSTSGVPVRLSERRRPRAKPHYRYAWGVWL